MAPDAPSRGCKRRPLVPAPVRLVALLLMSSSPVMLPAQQEAGKTEQPHFTRSKYRIGKVHLPSGPSGIQAATSRTRYRVNFGSREGVQPGSIFAVYQEHVRLGLVRVEEVWRDTSHVRIVLLERKLDPSVAAPLRRNHYLQPKLVLLETVHFAAGEPDFSEDMHQRLRYVARFARESPNRPLILEGHSDITGDDKENRILSEQRAEQIRNYLYEVQRLPIEQMHLKSYGSSEPIASNETEEGRRQNRRVEITLVDQLPDQDKPASKPLPKPKPKKKKRR
jgi:outer membrane protein OmpA-like peptidoglycan-associated protein